MRGEALSALALVFGCTTGLDKDSAFGEASIGEDLPAWVDCEAQPLESTGSASLIQMVPPPYGRNLSPSTPIVGFLAPGIPLSDVDLAAASVMADGVEVGFSTHTLQGETGNIFALFGDEPFPKNTDISVNVSVSGEPLQWSFHTGGYDVEVVTTPNFSFEDEVPEALQACPLELFVHTFYGFGDLVITDQSAGTAAPSAGAQHLLMSTGEVLSGAAVGATSSFITSHAIASGGADTMSLTTRFFTEADGGAAPREDVLLLILHGPDGARLVELGDSGAARGEAETSFPGLKSARGGREEVHTVRHISSLGTPLVLGLYLTDIGDPGSTSAVALDDIQLH